VTVSVELDDWDRHWQEYASSAEDNPAQMMRRRLIVRLLGLSGAGDRVLDVGSGQGDLLRELQRMYPAAELCGLEYSQAGVEISSRKVPSATFVQCDLLQRSDPPINLASWATHAVCSEVLEHVEDPGRLLVNARAFMRDGCRLVVTVPGGPMSAFDRHIGHRRHFGPASLRALMAKSGFTVELSRGFGFPFFNLYRLIVVGRGERLVRDVAQNAGGSSSRLARDLMRVFGALFRLNTDVVRAGWQIIAVARASR
jgi:2-polyprenyl-3-methyl-5-hydroxy-6-metoxy-1,4-benzoquinol methylase